MQTSDVRCVPDSGLTALNFCCQFRQVTVTYLILGWSQRESQGRKWSNVLLPELFKQAFLQFLTTLLKGHFGFNQGHGAYSVFESRTQQIDNRKEKWVSRFLQEPWCKLRHKSILSNQLAIDTIRLYYCTMHTLRLLKQAGANDPKLLRCLHWQKKTETLTWAAPNWLVTMLDTGLHGFPWAQANAACAFLH